MSTRNSGKHFLVGTFVIVGCAGACAGTPSVGEVTHDAGTFGGIGGVGNGGASATGGSVSSATGGTPGTGGTPNCQALVTNLSCVTDADCCVVSTFCGTALWLVTKAERAPLAGCLATPSTMCPACMAPEVDVSCQGGRCVGTKVGAAWPPTGLSAAHCGKVVTGSGGAHAAAAVATPASSTAGAPGTGGASSAPATTIFGCG